MSAPGTGMLAAGMLIWGWQTGHWFVSMPLGLLLETPRFIRTRWEISDGEFSRVADFCALIIVGTIIYMFAAQRSIYAVFAFIKWLPLAFFPLILAQRVSTRGGVDIRSISLILRRNKNARPLILNLGYPYLFMVLLSAGFANQRASGFYLAVLGMLLWALWRIRPSRYSLIVWAFLFSTVAVAGFGIQAGLSRLQSYLETKTMEWFYDYSERRIDPYRASTGIGYVGDLKLSSRVLFRVFPEHPSKPVLLAEAAYNRYMGNKWLAVKDDFESVPPEPDGGSWLIGEPEGTPAGLDIAIPLTDGGGMLKLPLGAFRLEDLHAEEVQINSLGAVKVAGGPDPLAYRVVSVEKQSRMAVPMETDLSIPRREEAAIIAVARQLDLSRLPPSRAVEVLSRYFEKNFRYTLRLRTTDFKTPLSGFLQDIRAGHCEYFATASALILRAAGIPTRYVTGFSAHEWSDLESCVLVRFRHAHAWTLAYIDGTWREADMTPSQWRSREDEAASFWQPASDLWSWVAFRLARWRQGLDPSTVTRYLPWLAVPLLIVFIRRFKPEKRRGSRLREKVAEDTRPVVSPLIEIEQYLDRILEIRRLPGQTYRQWLGIVERCGVGKDSLASLQRLVSLHYRLRFDPAGLSPAEYEGFEKAVADWLHRQRSAGEFI